MQAAMYRAAEVIRTTSEGVSNIVGNVGGAGAAGSASAGLVEATGFIAGVDVSTLSIILSLLAPLLAALLGAFVGAFLAFRYNRSLNKHNQ